MAKLNGIVFSFACLGLIWANNNKNPVLKNFLIISNFVKKCNTALKNLVAKLIYLICADSATLDYVLVNQD